MSVKLTPSTSSPYLNVRQTTESAGRIHQQQDYHRIQQNQIPRGVFTLREVAIGICAFLAIGAIVATVLALTAPKR